ncbi:hypothetical protein [Natronospora cellulosivora (SeqCode)]
MSPEKQILIIFIYIIISFLQELGDLAKINSRIKNLEKEINIKLKKEEVRKEKINRDYKNNKVNTYKDLLAKYAKNFACLKLIITASQNNNTYKGVLINSNDDYITLLDINYNAIHIPYNKIVCFQEIENKNLNKINNNKKEKRNNNQDIISPDLIYNSPDFEVKEINSFCGNTSSLMKEKYLKLVK